MGHRCKKNIIKHFLLVICGIFCHIASATPAIDGIQVYQKNLHLSEEHKEKLADDIYRYNNADNMWDELRREFVLPHYEDNPLVQAQISWFLNHQDFLQRTAFRAAPYLYFILQQVHKRHLPAEVVLLPMIESAYNPFAYSSVGAAGIWQMMPATASGFGIKQNWWYDGRRDVVASTRAALDYISYLGSFFNGNWLLAIAAYDTGEGNVLSAIKKNISIGRSTSYWELPLSQETRDYVPQLLALAVIISHPEEYPIVFPPVRNAPYLAQVDLGAQIDLKRAALLAGLSLTKLKQLNPGFSRGATGPHGPFKLVLPIENVQQFSENLARFPVQQPTNWIRYKIRVGDTLFAIARRFNISTHALQSANPMLAKNLKPGKHLLIPRNAPVVANNNENIFDSVPTKPFVPRADTPIQNLANALETVSGNYSMQPGDTLYMVRPGDDLQKIARHFHTTVKTLVAVNKLNQDIYQGQKIIVPTHLSFTSSTQKYQLTSGDTIYMVRKGDDLEKIARKFRTSTSAIRVINMLSNNDLHVGDQLVIPTHPG